MPHAGGGRKLLLLGCLQPSDIPTAAVDFHICGIAEDLLQQPHVAHAAATAVAAASHQDASGCLRRAMWLFRSSVNRRCWLEVSSRLLHCTGLLL
jgi:hypothetical protein